MKQKAISLNLEILTFAIPETWSWLILFVRQITIRDEDFQVLIQACHIISYRLHILFTHSPANIMHN